MDLPELENAAKTDAVKVMAEQKAVFAELDTAETKFVTKVKAHLVAIAFACGCLLGFIAHFAVHR